MERENLKILYVITKSNFGGAQKYVFELAEAAKNNGHDVTVALGGTGDSGAPLGKLADKLRDEAISVIKIESFMRNMSLVKDVKAFFELWKIIKKNKPNVLHLTSSKSGGIGALAGRLAGLEKIIFTSHGLTVDEVWRPRWQRILIYISTWITLKLTHQNIMISSETYHRAKNMPGLSKKVCLIKNGIGDINFIEKSKARKELALLVPSQSLWIGGIGELHPNKNWSVAIQAMIQLPNNCHLLIVGEGDDREKLKSLILQLSLQSRVHLLGYIEAAKYLKALDIFILPSKKEGLPYVLLEAGLAGLPIIASSLPGNKDIIETGKNGLLVEPEVSAVATSLNMLIRDEKMRNEFGIKIKKSIQNNFSIEKMQKETFALYDSSKSLAL